MRFQLRYPRGASFANFSLTSRDKPGEDLYMIAFGPVYLLNDVTKARKVKFVMPISIEDTYREFTLNWYNNVIQLHYVDRDRLVPIVEYRDDLITSRNIGFIKLYTSTATHVTQWLIHSLPINLSPKNKIFKDGCLHWVSMTNRDLPEQAFVGGFEDEIIYVARSVHNYSLCPGKYIPSQHRVFVPWGGEEHAKEQFDILCGYNAKWVKTHSNNIPENAFVGGFSELRKEPLYIGRAMIEGSLITGKVHVNYSTCYLPYKGREVEVSRYEILVDFSVPPQALEMPTYNVA
ncbi:uncharacterized protein LOC113230179 isoform X2 [Hyposmocoma kahamanoa]|nr:uncharacterized protein LOC113230179 isoform X2 [Hyposmocoma kahamanoa]